MVISGSWLLYMKNKGIVLTIFFNSVKVMEDKERTFTNQRRLDMTTKCHMGSENEIRSINELISLSQ